MCRRITNTLIAVYIVAFHLHSDMIAQEAKSQWWLASYNIGMEHLKNTRYELASSQFQSIIDEDDKIAEAYYGLGLVRFEEDSDSKGAHSYFRRAIALDRDFAAAFYRIGLVYKQMGNRPFEARKYFQIAVHKEPTLVEAWIELGQVEEKLWPYGTGLLGIYKKGVMIAPQNTKLYDHFINYSLWQDKEEEALTTLIQLSQKHPKEPRYLYDRARIHYLLQNLDTSLAIMDTIRQQFPDFSASRLNLVQCKIAFDQKRISEGLVYYDAAIANIKDSLDAQELFRDVCYILDDTTFERLRATPVDSQAVFFQRFWRSRDPDLSTVANENLVAYYQRLSYARRHYRLNIVGYKKSELEFADLHPYATHNIHGENLLLLTHFPKALRDERELDDLGLIYVRHGEPDQVVTSVNGIPESVPTSDQLSTVLRDLDYTSNLRDVYLFEPVGSNVRVPQPAFGENLNRKGYFANLPLNLSWRYSGNQQRSEMILHFKKFEGTTEWIIEAVPYTVAERYVLDNRYKELGRESFRARPDEVKIVKICEELKTENKNYVTTAMLTETYDRPEDAGSFYIPFQVLTFKGSNNKTLLQFFYGIQGNKIELAEFNSQQILNLHNFIGFYNSKWDEVLRVQKALEIPVEVNRGQWNTSALINIETVNVTPGEYLYVFDLKDQTSGRRGVQSAVCKIPAYYHDTLVMSDLLLSGPFTFSTQPARFSQSGIHYTPHMFTPYKKDDLVAVYFEIYNLTKIENRKTNFSVSAVLQTHKDNQRLVDITGFFRILKNDNRIPVRLTESYEGKSANEKVLVNFNLDDVANGDYNLVINVTDKNSNKNTMQITPLLVR